MPFVEFLSKEDFLIKEDGLELTVFHVRVFKTRKEGYMAHLSSYCGGFSQNSEVFNTKDEAKEEGKKMLDKKKKKNEEFLKSLK